MIFIFHALHLVKDTLVRTLVNIYCRRASKDLADNARAVRKSEVNMNSRVVMDEEGVKFSPPAYLQRYADVCDVIRTDPRWAGQIKKVVDFGCAELSLFTFLKSLAGLREVLHVDYDEGLLETHQHKVRPLLYDHLIHRETPFNVTVLQGSVCDPATHLLGCDAVICIELLEHLPPGVLDRVPHNIFGFIRPRVAVFTTPNSEFNVLFSRLKDGGFRHWDHRFEWTRQQFEDWAANIVSRYPEYTYEMGGVALGPEGTEHLGHCSQMAVFYNASYTKTDEETASSCTHKKKTEPPSQDWHNEEYTEEVHADISEDAVNADFMRLRIEEGVQSKGADISDDRAAGRSAETDQFQWDNINWGENAKEYKLIVEHEYPFSVDHRTRDEKILAHIWSKVHLYSHHQQEHCDDDDGDADDDFHDQWKVPLQCMVSDTSGFEISEDDLIRVMTANNIVVKDGFMLYKNERSDSGDDDDVPNNDFAASNVHYNNETIQNEECWDAPDDDFAVWNTSKESTRETSQAKHETDFTADSLDEDLANMDNYEEVETVTDYEMMDSGSLCDQNVILCSSPTVETSMADDRSQSNSPLAQFYVPNREAGEEQKLTDSGYIKSQDSPQSPVCSDTFSNDLITPDKDYPDMQSTTSILECIPENLNCLTPQHQTTSKEPSRQSSESRRKSVGPGINADDEFEKEPAISRPKSLHACSTKIEYPIASNFGLDSPWDMKDSPGSNIPEIFSPLEDEGVQLRRRFDVAVRNLPEVRHNVPERLARPDFLDVRNFEVEGENGDMLNNNLDFEGNHFDGVDDNIEVHNEEGSIVSKM